MGGISYSIPYNNNPESLRAALALNGRNGNAIREVFLSAPEFVSASGRILPSAGPEDFGEVIGMAHAAGARVNVVMNSVCEGDDWYTREYQTKLHRFIEWACGKYGMEAVTLANPLYIRLVHQWFPELEVCASVLADVDCMERAKVVADAGAATLTPDVYINRDLELLSSIRKETGMCVKVMVNEGCMHKCSFRKFHFNAVSHISKDTGSLGDGITSSELEKKARSVDSGLFFGSCNRLMMEDPSLMLHSGWVRPEDVHEYSGVTDFFKISGRTIPHEDLLRIIGAYMDERYDGNLLDVLDSSLRMMKLHHNAYIDNAKLSEMDAFSVLSACGHACRDCTWCEKAAETAIKVG